MRTRRLVLALAALTLPVALVVAPLPAATAGAPGTWTKITSGGVSNTAEPGMYRTADGVLHVAYLRQNDTDEDLAFTTISGTGKVVGTGDILTGWEGLPSDPKLVGTADGGVRAVFGGVIGATGSPFSDGRIYTSTADAAGADWTLQTVPLAQSVNGYASYGTGATTLTDGTPAVSFPLNRTLTWNVGGSGTDQSDEFGACCLYSSTLARDASDRLFVAFAANGSEPANAGVFVKQLLPAAGTTIKAPQSTKGSSADFLMASQSTPLVERDGSFFTAYCLGYPTCTGVGLWEIGTPKPLVVPGSKGAQEYAVAVGPGGRIWVAWAEANTNRVRVSHTGTDNLQFGAVTTIKHPLGKTIYGIAVEASDGSADVIVNTGDALLHQQVLPALTLKASPGSWKKGTQQKVAFSVTEAGADVAGAKVTAAGKSCTTKAAGTCAITFSKTVRKNVVATARLAGYGSGKVVLKVKK